ncbi:tryptophan-rich sensory protein [Flaviramulus basaltis]|uniref:Tryptophan-rich sensory protein n=1 Tax=Flaviramulus basaltis TaxID=369401 RepID=A0A1K2IG11_9FLAO|nr:TspO/MBR family protein [Flaviramulus basaltis]SFZ91365.1 tryptophan-rich sensory protein [Flaviramulus basaltis]
MKLFKYISIFLVINFVALAIGTWLMNDGPKTDWYQNLNKAPWTPAGWVFGVAWTSIMICFSVYMAYLYKVTPSKKILTLFSIQFVFNVIWNYVFFNQHLIGLGLLVILILTIIVATFIFLFKNTLKTKSILILPYFLWLCIATSLNAYILIYN